jgi:BlaI family transcriptional regulator, penicillinase repressor
MMGPETRNITDAEWAVLELLWDKGPATVRQLTDTLYPKGGPSEYATVHKLLERLENKSCVRRERSGGVFSFQASIDRDTLVGQQLEDLVDKRWGGALGPLLTNLLRSKRLSHEELRDLRALVDRLEKKSKPKRG